MLKWLGRLLLALLFSLLVGLAIGTALRMRMEKPVTYLGSATAPFDSTLDAQKAPGKFAMYSSFFVSPPEFSLLRV